MMMDHVHVKTRSTSKSTNPAKMACEKASRRLRATLVKASRLGVTTSEVASLGSAKRLIPQRDHGWKLAVFLLLMFGGGVIVALFCMARKGCSRIEDIKNCLLRSIVGVDASARLSDHSLPIVTTANGPMWAPHMVVVLENLDFQGFKIPDLPAGERFIVARTECGAKHGVNPEMVTQFLFYPPEPSKKCFIACFMKELGTINADGTMNIEKMLEYHIPSDKAYQDKMFKRFEECRAKKGENECETAFAFQWCCFEKSRQRPMRS